MSQWDARGLPLKENGFRDGYHLADSGTVIYSREIALHLAAILRENPSV